MSERGAQTTDGHEEALGYTLGTGRMFVPMGVFHAWAERLLGRPIMTHEFAMHDTWDELREVFEEAATIRVKSPSLPEPGEPRNG